jgi:hypothetical protein
VAALLVIGAALVVIGFVLLFNLAGAGDFVMRHVTSKNLGTLPPGYANTKTGFRVYAVMVVSIGVVFVGVFVAGSAVVPGVLLIFAGVAGFGATSVMGIRGETATYRELKR